jgi:hypothetical protein
VDKNTIIDFSYTFGSWDNTAAYYNNTLYVWETEESIETKKLLFGLKFNF